jgi:hypothetical protein
MAKRKACANSGVNIAHMPSSTPGHQDWGAALAKFMDVHPGQFADLRFTPQ